MSTKFRPRVARCGLLGLMALVGATYFPMDALGQVIREPGGVYVDTEGVLKVRDASKGDRLNKAKRGRKESHPGFVYISLPKLFAEVQQKLAANEPVPDSMRYLDGMVKLQYVFVYPEEKDVVIAGKAETWEPNDAGRPLGNESRRPVLRLDDLVVALRTVGPGAKTRSFGCSIDLPADGIARAQTAAGRIGAVQRGQYGGIPQTLARAVGMQPIRFINVEPDTQFAFVLVEADFIMKTLGLGLIRSPVRGVNSHIGMMRPNEGIYNRWWFTANYAPLLTAADGNAFEIRGQALQVRSSDSPTGDHSTGSPSAQKFAEQLTEHFVPLAAEIPAFADLWNVTDLGVLAALIAEDRLAERCTWNLSWVMDEKGYPVPTVNVPKETETLANYKVTGRTLCLTLGGVTLDMDQVVGSRNRERDRANSLRAMARPVVEGWSRREEQ